MNGVVTTHIPLTLSFSQEKTLIKSYQMLELFVKEKLLDPTQ
jgi:hypothetical protein